MPTPTQHATTVTTFVARTANTNLTPPLADEYLAAEIHAHLSAATGTGDAYTAADALLATAEALPVGSRHHALHKALIHAVAAPRSAA